MEGQGLPNMPNLMKLFTAPLAQIAQGGQPIDFTNPQTLTNNPAVNAAMGNAAQYGAMGPMMAGMMGHPLSGGFSITHVSVQPMQPSPKSLRGRKGLNAQQKLDAMRGRRQDEVNGRQQRAIGRKVANLQPGQFEQLPAQAMPMQPQEMFS